MLEMKSIKRGNKLSLLFQELFDKKTQKLHEAKMNYGFNLGFIIGQHTNKLRQQKLAYMAQFGLKTGKQFRRHMKSLRRQEKLNDLQNN